MRNTIFGLIVLTLLSVGGSSWSDCAGIVAPTPYARWETLSPRAKYEGLLKMLGTTTSPNVNVKDIMEKDNEIEMGVSLSGDRILLLKYAIQNQREPRVAWLQKIELVNAIGKNSNVSKEPIDEITQQPNPLEVKDSPELTKEVNESTFPAIIDAQLLNQVIGTNRYLSFGPRVNLKYVKPFELRTRSPLWLMATSKSRSFTGFINRKVTPNLARNAIFLGLLTVFLGGGLDDMRSKSPVGAIAHMMHPTASVGEEISKKPATKEIVQSIKDNQQIEPVDKNWLVSQLQTGTTTPAPSVKLQTKDFEVIPGLDNGTIWLRQRSTGRIFIGLLSMENLENGEAQLRVVEVPSSNMPNTFAQVSKLFPAPTATQ